MARADLLPFDYPSGHPWSMTVLRTKAVTRTSVNTLRLSNTNGSMFVLARHQVWGENSQGPTCI